MFCLNLISSFISYANTLILFVKNRILIGRLTKAGRFLECSEMSRLMIFPFTPMGTLSQSFAFITLPAILTYAKSPTGFRSYDSGPKVSPASEVYPISPEIQKLPNPINIVSLLLLI